MRGRASLLLLLPVVGLPGTMAAQSLDDLEAPGSPGFTILGLQPSAIERPTTPREFGLSLLSAVGEGNVIPQDFAIEIAPYWLTPKPELTFSERYEPTFWQSVKQSFAVSIATDRPEDPTTEPTRLGVGIRFLPSPGRAAPRSDQLLARIDSLNAEGNRISALDIPRLGQAADSLARSGFESRQDSARLDAVRDSLTERRERLAVVDRLQTTATNEFRKLDMDRTAGLRWEVAAALASSFPRSNFDSASLTALGVWTTVSLRPDASNLDVVATVRYQHADLPVTAGTPPTAGGANSQDMVDVGARVIFGSGPFQASAEALRRFAFEIDSHGGGTAEVGFGTSYRVAATAEYALSDGLALSWTLGRDFELIGGDAADLLSFLGLKLGLGRSLDSNN